MTEVLDAAQIDLLGKEAFLEHVVDPTPGWLDRYAAKRTVDLLDFQHRCEIGGSLYEVGLFWGKYFSLLVRASALTRERVLGLDTFEYVGIDDFKHEFFGRLRADDRLRDAEAEVSILKCASGDLTAAELLKHLGREARFISIDGSHEYDDVLWDLSVADQVLAAGGIIAADDFLHPISLGVTAALFHYFESNATLVPFAHVTNKLFLCRPAWADRYRDALQTAILDDTTDAKSMNFRSQIEGGHRINVEAVFRGFRVLTVPLFP